uniref:Glycosyltransferase RgtA/B/C/D-like domain-containing protein n=1 Tax=Desulfobacca acetoxidans TaxID=60893 RepID=A0A7V6DR51_9BACT
MAAASKNHQGTWTSRFSQDTLYLLIIWGAGIILRLWDMSARNLWTDEAWVALAALAPTPGAALTLGRSTPPFYTLTVWGLAQTLGGSEAVLRSLSFAFGVGTLILFWFVARRLASRAASLAGLALVAVSPVLVYFSKELKQYSGDAFFALLVVWLAERLQERPGKAPWLALALAGSLALGFSHGAVFVLPTILVVLWLKTPRPPRRWVAGLGACWGLAVIAFYFLVYRHQVNPMLVNYWGGDYPNFAGLMPFSIWLAGALGRYFHYFFHYFFFSTWGWLWGAVFTAQGILTLAHTGPRRLLLYWGGPLLLTLAAASGHRYPFMGHYNGSRLLLFSAPWLYLLTAIGLTAAFAWLRRLPQRWPIPALAVLILITAQPLALLQEDLRPLDNRQELKPLAAYLQDHILPGDQVYVYLHAIYPFKYYYRGNVDGVLWGTDCTEKNLHVPAAGLDSPQRLWLVAAHFPDIAYLKLFAAKLLGPGWHEEALISRHNAALFLFIHQNRLMTKSRHAPPELPQSAPLTPSAGTACPETPLPPRQ